MEKITVKPHGNQIWDPIVKGAEIALALANKKQVCIDFFGEAPDIEDTALPEFFEYLKSQGLDLDLITVKTGNQLEQFNKIKIQYDHEAFYEIELFQKNLDKIPTHKQIRYHFGNFISKTSLPRLVIASHLFSNYRDKTLQTFHYNHSDEYHKTHLELNELVHLYGPYSTEFDEAVNLLKASPIVIEPVKSYPILQISSQLENVLVPCQWYPEIFVDVICETWYQGTNFYVTEKLWRAISTKTPFIVQGTQNVLGNLKKLGFQTFDKFWDEGYQEDFSFYNITEIKKVLQKLSGLSLDQIYQMHEDMKQVLDHNYDVFGNLSRHDIKKIREG